MLYLMMSILAAGGYARRRIGARLIEDFGFVGAIGIVMLVIVVIHLLQRAAGNVPEDEGDKLAREKEESERARGSAGGPPRFNG